jgi:hypothetical protein
MHKCSLWTDLIALQQVTCQTTQIQSLEVQNVSVLFFTIYQSGICCCKEDNKIRCLMADYLNIDTDTQTSLYHNRVEQPCHILFPVRQYS